MIRLFQTVEDEELVLLEHLLQNNASAVRSGGAAITNTKDTWIQDHVVLRGH